MKNSHRNAALRTDAFAASASRQDDDIDAEIAALRGEREQLQEDREKKRLRVVDLSARIAALEAIGPIRKAQRKLGGVSLAGSGDVRMKVEPATVKVKPKRK